MGVPNPAPYTMRQPCRFCAKDDGVLHMDGYRKESNGQDVVRCSRCDRHVYNAPKTETGTPQRTIKSRPDLKFGQRERIISRDGARCQICGRDPIHHEGIIIVIAHAVSVKEGRALGVADEDLFDDANLFASCEECNAEMGSKSLEPKIMVKLIMARISRARNSWGK